MDPKKDGLRRGISGFNYGDFFVSMFIRRGVNMKRQWKIQVSLWHRFDPRPFWEDFLVCQLASYSNSL